MFRSGVHLTRVLLFTLFVMGCQENERTATPPAVVPSPVVVPSPGVVASIDAAAGPPRPGDTLTLSGLTIKLLDSGEIQLSGLDRWGTKLDTTFESREYLTKALPTLERSLTDEQAARLKSILQSMQ